MLEGMITYLSPRLTVSSKCDYQDDGTNKAVAIDGTKKLLLPKLRFGGLEQMLLPTERMWLTESKYIQIYIELI